MLLDNIIIMIKKTTITNTRRRRRRSVIYFSTGDIRSENGKTSRDAISHVFLTRRLSYRRGRVISSCSSERPGGEPARQYRTAAGALAPPKRQLCTYPPRRRRPHR